MATFGRQSPGRTSNQAVRIWRRKAPASKHSALKKTTAVWLVKVSKPPTQLYTRMTRRLSRKVSHWFRRSRRLWTISLHRTKKSSSRWKQIKIQASSNQQYPKVATRNDNSSRDKLMKAWRIWRKARQAQQAIVMYHAHFSQITSSRSASSMLESSNQIIKMPKTSPVHIRGVWNSIQNPKIKKYKI